MPLSQKALNKPPSKMFMAYVARLVFRAVLFGLLVYAFVVNPEKLDLTMYFGLTGGVNLVDVLFVGVFADMMTKFLPKANISMGSLKQFGDFHVPSFAIFRGGKEGFIAFVEASIASGKTVVQTAKEKGLAFAADVREGTLDTARSLMRDVSFLRSLTYQEEDLTGSKLVRDQIRRDRAAEILPVVVFWIVFNGLIMLALAQFGWFNQRSLVLWCGFYFVFDMISVVFWCPIQLFLMKNRCCTTCQIFNWDAIMTATPLIPLFFVTPFATVLVLLSIVVLLRWEVSFITYPERFDERTNQSLKCSNCNDKLCYFRAPLAKIASEIKLP